MRTPSISTTRLTSQLNILLDTDMPLFIHGSPGIGKSYIVNEMAKERSWELIDVRLSQLDPVDLRGIPSIVDGQTVWMPPVFFPKKSDVNGILFLDELNSAPPSVQAAIYQLILDRKLGEYELPSSWRIVCAGNRISDRGVVFKLPTPLANRMVHLNVEARFDDFKLFAIKNALHSFIIGFLGFRPDLLSTEPVSEDDSNPAFATPRTWHFLSNILKNNNALEEIEPIIYGTIGYAAGMEFLSYVKVYENIPNVKAIYDGIYPEADTLNSPALLYALVSALVEYFDGSDVHTKHLFAFSEVLPTEFGVMLIKDSIVKNEDIAASPYFDDWLAKYGEYIL